MDHEGTMQGGRFVGTVRRVQYDSQGNVNYRFTDEYPPAAAAPPSSSPGGGSSAGQAKNTAATCNARASSVLSRESQCKAEPALCACIQKRYVVECTGKPAQWNDRNVYDKAFLACFDQIGATPGASPEAGAPQQSGEAQRKEQSRLLDALDGTTRGAPGTHAIDGDAISGARPSPGRPEQGREESQRCGLTLPDGTPCVSLEEVRKCEVPGFVCGTFKNVCPWAMHVHATCSTGKTSLATLRAAPKGGSTTGQAQPPVSECGWITGMGQQKCFD